MIDSLLAEAFINSKYRVLGRKLRPYCLWHEFLLLASENPLFCKSEEPLNVLHLEAALRICQCRFGEVPAAIKWPVLVSMKAAFLGLDKNLEVFRTYVADYNSGPQIWQNQSEGQTSLKNGPPGTIYTAISCMSLGISESRAWEMPIGMALWYSSTRQFDKSGDMDFVTEESRRKMEQLKELLDGKKQDKQG